MAATTLNLLDHVVPKVGLRQFVFTVPHALRARLAYDGPLMGAVSRIFVDSVLGCDGRGEARGPPFWQSRVRRRRYGEPPDAAQA